MINLSIGQYNKLQPYSFKFQGSYPDVTQEKSIQKDCHDNTNKTNRNNTKQAVLSYTGGIGVFFLSKIAKRYPLRSINKNFKTDENISIKFSEAKTAAQKMYEKYKLKNQGVIYNFIEEDINKEQEKIFKKAFGKESMPSVQFKKWLYSRLNGGLLAPFKLDNKKKYLALATKENASVILHEFGHALNKKNIIIKLFNRNYYKHLPLIFWITALTCNPKDKDDKHSKLKETGIFIKSNVGLLTFASYSLKLVDEALASIKALKFAKGNALSLYMPLKRNLAWAYSSYIVNALCISGGIKLSVWAKDKIANHYEKPNLKAKQKCDNNKLETHKKPSSSES